MRDQILFREGNDLEVASVQDLFRSSEIRRPVEDAGRISAMLRNANLVITAWDGEKLVGIGRALTDFSYCCYLSDLAVRAEYQRQGIGERIIALMRDKLGTEVSFILLAAPEAMPYYPRLGFAPIDNGWIIRRSR